MIKGKTLLEQAMYLGRQKNTEYAYSIADKYEEFAELIEEAYRTGRIDAKYHDELACIAFYDYPDMYSEEEE